MKAALQKAPDQRRQARRRILNKPEREDLRNAALMLMRSLPWRYTTEGADYWRGIYNRLRDLGAGGAL